MSRTEPKTGFDCLEFKRRVQAEIYEEIKDLSRAEQVEYFRRRADTSPFGPWRQGLIRRLDQPAEVTRPPAASPE